MKMPIGYYAWYMFMNALFVVLVTGRKYWAYKLQRFDLFYDLFDKHEFTLQESALTFLFISAFIINFITLTEVSLYYGHWIDNAYFKLYIRDIAQSFIHILASMACITFAFRFSKKEVSS